MNKINFDNTGGFPLKAPTLDFMQDAYSSLSSLAGLGGQNYILSGCDIAGGNVSDGTIVINGEVLPFVGGAKLARVIIEETSSEATFKDGTSKPVYYTRVAKMAAAGGVMDFDSLKRVSNLLAIADRIKDQEVVKWIASSTGSGMSITEQSCWMFKQGRFVVLKGSVEIVNTVSSGVTGFSLTGIPNLGNTGERSYGNVVRRNLDALNISIVEVCYKLPETNAIAFQVNFSANTGAILDFNLMIFLPE
ncbi:hypothetical protein [Sphingobacterium multivorum]|uniref:hypothetical protein n=1 Tax=Sphingobacterium multivorum TaxID=28454 RepID=UPI0028A12E1C|nr:hypothetical protein [Sphingobacterium multivorum]